MQELRNPETVQWQTSCRAWDWAVRHMRTTILMRRQLTCNDGHECFDDYQLSAPAPGKLPATNWTCQRVANLPVKVRRPKWKRAATTPVAKSPCTEQ